MSEPTTKTGKRLVSLNTPSETEFWTKVVLDIEREAYREGWTDAYESQSAGSLHDRADCIKDRDRAVVEAARAERERLRTKAEKVVLRDPSSFAVRMAAAEMIDRILAEPDE